MTNRLEQLFAAAEAARARGDGAQASAQLMAVLQAAPEHPRALNSLGALALNAGDPVVAAGFFRRAAAADPRTPLLWLNLANACLAAGDDAGEGEALDKALAIDPFMLPAFLKKGQWLERRGETKAAITMYQRLVANLPSDLQLPPAMVQAIDRARDLVAADGASLATVVDAQLASLRSKFSGTDTHRFEHAVDIMLGRRRLYQNMPTGLHYPYLAPIQFHDRSAFAWLPDLEAATATIRAELLAVLSPGEGEGAGGGVGPGFAPYVALPPEMPVQQWTALNHSADWSSYFFWKHGERQADNCARCPQTAAILETLPLFDCPGRGPSVMFSLLKPHTRIPPHSGTTNIRLTTHLPLVVPPHCAFRVGSETRAWTEGEALVFDDSIEHEAVNDSDQLRAVLILDVWNPALTAPERILLGQLFATLDDHGGKVSTFEP
jgi:aspartate beta-hydroxylase